MNFKIIKLALVSGIFAMPVIADEQTPSSSRPSTNEIETIIKSSAILGFEWIDAPLNKVILIKHSQGICAIQFVSYSRDNNRKEPTVFSSGEETFHGEAYIALMKNEAFSAPKKIQLSKVAPIGLLKFYHDGSKDVIKCGNTRVTWIYPTGLHFYQDESYSFSITGYESLEKIDYKSKNLNWYKYSEDRKATIIPIEDLKQ